MNAIKVFENSTFGSVRTVTKEGEPWFVAADVCRALEIDRTATRRLDDDEKGVHSTHTPGGDQEITIVNEPGLYALVLGSRKPEARAFKRWITHEVIPDIRRHGFYANEAALDHLMNDPDSLIIALERYRDEKKRRLALEEKACQDAPKVLFADSVEASSQSILIGVLAKMLKQNGLNIGQNRLFERLRNEGFLCASGDRRNLPTQRSLEQGLMEIKERTINNPDGTVRLTLTPVITGKGQVYFVNRYRPETTARWA